MIYSEINKCFNGSAWGYSPFVEFEARDCVYMCVYV